MNSHQYDPDDDEFNEANYKEELNVVKGTEIVWSPEQSAIFEAFANHDGNIEVQARAGTGKTTTITEAFAHAPEPRILYAVFNKRNQTEANAKIQDFRVDVRTLHSLGLLFIRKNWRDAVPDDDVEIDRVKTVCGPGDEMFNREVLKLVAFAKNYFISTEAGLSELIEAEGIEGNVRELCGAALKVLDWSKEKDEQARISFNDMVWLPVVKGWCRPSYGLVVIDEAQDMNLPQLLMAMAATSGRVAIVGDPRQTIYGFRGAVRDGMAMMRERLQAKTFPLTITYRCPKSVVKIAQEIVPDYRAADTAPDGTVGTIKDDVTNWVSEGDAILSRLNAPLMPLALSLLRKNVPARIEGKDIGKQILGMVRSLKAKSVPHFLEKVQNWQSKQVARLAKIKKSEKQIERINDMAATLKALAQDAQSVGDIEARINNLFGDSDKSTKPSVVLSSVHKAKGLEWDRVFLLKETFRKGKGTEEDNIWYVAVTRSKSELYFVN